MIHIDIKEIAIARLYLLIDLSRCSFSILLQPFLRNKFRIIKSLYL